MSTAEPISARERHTAGSALGGGKHAKGAGGLQSFRSYPTYRKSGIEWLGQIPEHWSLMRLKRIVEFRGGGTPAKDNLEYWRGDIPWVSPKDMKVSVVSETEWRTMGRSSA